MSSLFVRCCPISAGLDREILEDHRRSIHAHMERGHFPGMCEGVVVNGRLVYKDTCGCSDGELQTRMTERTLFRGYSMMKPITATAFMSLVEERLVRLDDPVSRYLPKFADLEVRRKDGAGLEPLKVPMTLRHLLMHTSGLGYGPGRTDRGDRLVARTESEKSLRDLSERQDSGEVDSLEKLCDALSEKPLMFQPGAGYEYGLSLDVLGRVMELVTGQPLRRIIRERVLVPAGMKDARWDVPASSAKDICGYYRLMRSAGSSERWLERLDGGKPEESAYVRGSAAHYSAGVPSAGGYWGTFRTAMLFSMRDVLRFCQMIINEGMGVKGQRVLKAKTVRYSRRNWLRLKSAADCPMPPGWTSESVGWCPLGHVQLDGPHSGSLFMGGMSYFWIDPRRRIGAAIMTETYWQVRPLGWVDTRDTLDEVLQRAVKSGKRLRKAPAPARKDSSASAGSKKRAKSRQGSVKDLTGSRPLKQRKKL